MADVRRQLHSAEWETVDRSENPSEFVEYLDQFTEASRAGRLEDVLVLGIRPGDSTLDVGCGTGELVIDLAAAAGSAGRSVGVDLSRIMIEAARERAAATSVPVELLTCDARDLPFACASFDVVHCDRLLQHLDRPDVAVSEMARVLAPGGRLMLKEPDWDGFMVDADDRVTTRAVRDALAAHIRQPQIGRSLRRLALDAGLDLIDFGGGTGLYAISRAAADRMWSLEAHLEDAVTTGTIERDDANAWWSHLETRDKSGQFFASAIGFRVIARKHR